MSGVERYYLEIFKLDPNIHGELIEMHPLDPVYSIHINNSGTIQFPTFTPPSSGMYSVLLQTADYANNSKIARQLVLYDKDSVIEFTKPGMIERMPTTEEIQLRHKGDGGFHVLSAIPETGYLWQSSANSSKTDIAFNWENHFVNRIVETGKLLNKVLPYPTQFEKLQDDGVLRSTK